MSAQTSYSRNPNAAIPGLLADAGPHRIVSRYNGEASNVPAGIFMAQSLEGKALLPAAATDKLAGIVLNTFARNPGDVSVSLSGSTDAYAPKHSMPLLEEGAAWVRCEQAMAVSDKVYVRFASGTGTQLGAIRKDPDGVAQVTTVTPTAVNSTVYVLRVEVPDASNLRPRTWTFEYISDGTATATEICNGFRTLMQADSAFNALIASSGTTTLILTAATAGVAFTVNSEGDGTLAVAATTPPAATCRLVRGARVDVPSTGAGVCKVVFSGSADNAAL